MKTTPRAVGLLLLGVLLAACDESGGTGGSGGQSSATTSVTSMGTSMSTGMSTSTGSSTSATMSTSASTSTGMQGAPTAADLKALTANCTVASTGEYATDEGESDTISVCAVGTAFFWTSDFDVDCDGKESVACNITTDNAYQPETSATDSQGDPLDAAALPFVVIPLPSSKFDFGDADIHLGAVAAVVYQDKVVYAVFGDEGPSGIIGEGSYALAQALGIDPDPSTGGTDGPVTFIVFSGTNAIVSPIEDHAAATAQGEEMAAKLLADN